MSVEGWKAVRDQVELIATEVVNQQRTRDVIFGLHERGLLTDAQVTHLKVNSGVSLPCVYLFLTAFW